MRRLVVIEFMSLDGVIQSPGRPDEDESGGFTQGGWIRPFSDPVLSATVKRQMELPFDLLLGRVTFEIWTGYWPLHKEAWPAVETATKYVVSDTMTRHEWEPSVFLGGDVAGKIAELKRQPGPDLHVYGSATLVQTLLVHGLVDALRLKIYPVSLGCGKRLFADGTAPASFKLTGSEVTPSGVIMVEYERSGGCPARP